MKIKSAMVTQASGSVGGVTASHNRGGMYLRARATPTNPNTLQQQVIRGFVAQLTSLWLSVLTADQRASWDLYALQVPLPDRLGEPRNVGGLAMYVRSNVPRLQKGLPRVDDGPTTFNLGAYSPVTFGILSEAAGTVDINFGGLDEWVSEDDAAMLIFSSRAQNQSVNYFKGPYRAGFPILGDSGAPPPSPFEATPAFPFVEGQKLFWRINVTRADGRLAAAMYASTLAVA